MKIARNILWALFPISFIIRWLLVRYNVINTLLVSNISVAIIFAIPVTAALLQTIMNKEKNLSPNYFILKLAVVIYLYIMIGFMFGAAVFF
ncbi:MAG: hypothetical protein IKM06_06790 [Clostridia bacterium]|nr:hypothetical protein [Clostridia bacterium]